MIVVFETFTYSLADSINALLPSHLILLVGNTHTHTHTQQVGSAVVPATGKSMVVGPQAVSVTFGPDGSDKVKAFTGGYIADVRDGNTKDAGAMFAVMKVGG